MYDGNLGKNTKFSTGYVYLKGEPQVLIAVSYMVHPIVFSFKDYEQLSIL